MKMAINRDRYEQEIGFVDHRSGHNRRLVGMIQHSAGTLKLMLERIMKVEYNVSLSTPQKWRGNRLSPSFLWSLLMACRHCSWWASVLPIDDRRAFVIVAVGVANVAVGVPIYRRDNGVHYRRFSAVACGKAFTIRVISREVCHG